MARIFVHIGLPKTATTTLQAQLFPSINEKFVKYLGVFQPRNVGQNLQYINFFQAIKSGEVEKSRNEIGGMLQAGQSLLISEEMILVSMEGADWRANLKCLAGLLRGFDYKLILTVREPVSAMHSYYVENNALFSGENMSFLQLAKHDPRMEIFHYGKLLSEISTLFDTERVFVKKFEDIIAGDVRDLCELLGQENNPGSRVVLKDANFKKRSSAYVFTGKDFTFSDMVRYALKKAGIIDLILVNRLKKVARSLITTLDLFSIKEVRVAKPTAVENKYLREYLQEETQVLERLYGIKYV